MKDVKQNVEKMHILLSGKSSLPAGIATFAETQKDSEKREIHKWLVTTNPSDIHNRSRKLYEPGTGSWMLRESLRTSPAFFQCWKLP